MVWINEEQITWSEDNMEAEINVDKKNVTMKFDVLLVGTDVASATKKIQEAVDNINWASFGRYDAIELMGSVMTEKDGLHYKGTLTTERRTLTGKHDSEELSCFLSDMLDFSGIKKWPERDGFAQNEKLKELVAVARAYVSDFYEINDDNYNGNKEHLDYLVREQLAHVFGDRDLSNRDTEGVLTFGSLEYHGISDEQSVKKIDIFLEKGGEKYKLMTDDEILYYAKSHQINNIKVAKRNTSYHMNMARVDENIFNCQHGMLIYINKGYYLAFRDDEGFDVYSPEEFESDLQVVDIEIPEPLKGNIKCYFGDNPDDLGTLENSNKITTTRMTIGVMPGYNVKNPTDDRAMELAECAVKEVKSSILEDIPMPNIELKPAIAVYLPEWGCPQGGEKCIQVDIGPMEKSEAALFAMGMQAALDQSTVTVNFVDDENLYITRDENKIPQIKRFSSMQYDILLDENDPKTAGEKIQVALQEYGKTHQDAQIYATGAVVVEHDGSLHYVGSRNAIFCQDEDSFEKALSDMLGISGIVRH